MLAWWSLTVQQASMVQNTGTRFHGQPNAKSHLSLLTVIGLWQKADVVYSQVAVLHGQCMHLEEPEASQE